MRKSRQIQKEYDKTAKFYDSRYLEIQQKKYDVALSSIELKGRILDLGAGTGLLSKFLDMELISVDISINMLLQGGKEKSIQAAAESLPFKDDSFDYILSFSALMNFEDPESSLGEVKRVLKKKGIFVCSHLKKFNFEEVLKKKFNIIEKMICGEDVIYILK